MTVSLEVLKDAFKVQIDRGVTNLFFFTKETAPHVDDDWYMRAYPANEVEKLIPYLENYVFYRVTNHLPRFYRK